MANLSDLLNPAPQPERQLPAPTTQSNEPGCIADGHRDRASEIRPANIHTEGSPRRPSITSPLHALAEAASSATTAPLRSSAHPIHSSSHHDLHHRNLPSPLSRPTSSHTSPPNSFGYSGVSQQPIGQLSPRLERYHHSSGDEARARRVSDVANSFSGVLPPLQRSSPDENARPLAALEPHIENDTRAGSREPVSSLRISPSIEPTRPEPEPLSPVTTQMRQPSPVAAHPTEASDIPEKQAVQVEVKTEMSEIPPELSGVGSQTDAPMTGMPTEGEIPVNSTSGAPAISGSVTNISNDSNFRPSPRATTIESSTRPSSAKPKPPPTKKRAAPKKGTASTKKATNKKRKLDNDSVASSPALPRIGTPTSSRASKTPAPKGGKQGSVTPARSSSIANGRDDDEDEEMDEGDSSELFCICRGPDDHTWMIGCDGPCEGWFHGRCVNINERDGNLIEKYYCPDCTKEGERETLWKPMCRLETCRKPARIIKGKPSKYCCDDHGVEFMRQRALGDELESPEQKRSSAAASTGGRRKSRKDNYTDHWENGSEFLYEDQEDESHLRGGVLRPAEIKTLASTAKDISDFLRLGEGVLSPPETVSPEEPSKATYTPEETAQLETIKTKTEELKQRKQLLDDRETFVNMAKARARSLQEEMKKKEKNAVLTCGFDPRLVWEDDQFAAWRNSPEGQEAFRTGQLASLPATSATDITMTDPDAATNGVPIREENKEKEEGLCMTKRCKRHNNAPIQDTWQKLQTHEMAHEKDLVREQMRKLIAKEKSVKERAAIRGLEE